MKSTIIPAKEALQQDQTYPAILEFLDNKGNPLGLVVLKTAPKDGTVLYISEEIKSWYNVLEFSGGWNCDPALWRLFKGTIQLELP